jgi:hypothetical protein
MSLDTTTVGGRSVKYRSAVKAAWPLSRPNQRHSAAPIATGLQRTSGFGTG